MPAATAPAEHQVLRFPHSEALLRNVLESGSVGTVLVSPEGRVTYANPAFTELLGYSIDEAMGLSVKDLVHPDFVEEAQAQVRDMIAGTIDHYRTERVFKKKDGETIWLLVSGSILRNERTGKPTCIITQLTDIDRQKRAEAALAEVESRWNLALESAGQGVWDHNRRDGTMFYSRMWRIMRGMAPDEEVDGAMELWLTRVHPEDRDRIRNIVIRQDAGEIPYNAFEYRERHRDGHYIWILSRGRPVDWFPDGTPARIAGTDTDISALKRAQEEIADEKERLNVTLQSIGDGVISTDAGARVTFINPMAEKMTGWSLADAVGRPVGEVFDIVSETNATSPPNPVAMCLAQQQPFRVDDDVVLIGRHGEQRNVRESAAPVRTPDGRIIGAVLVFQDVTQSRALQRQLAHSAMHDGLTRLPNRSAFERALRSACEQSEREKREHVLGFIDLDRFKTVNDTAGHAAGDALLRRVGEAIRGACRAQDFTARIGGDEFALILADCPMPAGERIAQQIVEAVSAIRFDWAGREYRVGASVGLAAIRAGAADPAEAMSRADTACYAAKAAGQDGRSVFVEADAGNRRSREQA